MASLSTFGQWVSSPTSSSVVRTFVLFFRQVLPSAGYTPFDRDTQQQEMQAIIAGDYKFEPEEYWANVSQTARDFVRSCLTIDPDARPTADEALKHPWLASATPHYVADPESPSGGPKDLLPQVKKAFDAKKTCECATSLRVRSPADALCPVRKAVLSMVAMRRMSALAHSNHPLETKIGGQSLRQLLEESEKVGVCMLMYRACLADNSMQENVDAEQHVMHFHHSSSEGGSSAGEEHSALVDALSSVNLSAVPK